MCSEAELLRIEDGVVANRKVLETVVPVWFTELHSR